MSNQTPEQLRQMYLAGTVSIPPRFPELAEISFVGKKRKDDEITVIAKQEISPKVVISRTFFKDGVKAIFEPANKDLVDFKKGTWYVGDELKDKIEFNVDKPAIDGILFVCENAQSILEMSAGLTAAESAEYYPPLPDDRSVNHYNMEKRPGCHY